MIFHTIGTCAGTEPMPGRHHTSLALETGNGLYFFDAGESCAYTSYLMGLDPRSIRAVFISHTHMDHIGGLGNLFWNVRKMTTLDHVQPGHDIELYVPRLEAWDAIYSLLKLTEGGFETSFSINPHSVSDGIIFDDGYVKVEALHNTHLERTSPWHSFSYRISCEEKTIIYSGDVGAYSDMKEFLRDGCDLLFVETGHHTPDKAAEYITGNGFDVKELAYIHNGWIILESRKKASEMIASAWNRRFRICEDAQSFEL